MQLNKVLFTLFPNAAYPKSRPLVGALNQLQNKNKTQLKLEAKEG